MVSIKSLAVCAAAAASAVSALSTVSRRGRYLYNAEGARFMIKGIAYQEAGTLQADSAANAANGGFPEPSDYVDPLADSAACTRDLPYLRQLGVNVVHIYSVNSSLNHDSCMSTFSSAGIYTIIDLALPLNGSIDRASPSWHTGLLNLYTTTIDAFSKYDNVLAFNIANEVVTTTANTAAAPFIKAAARDTKAYLRSKNNAALVGYSSTDMATNIRNPLATYLACASDDESIDLFGLNNYEWAGDSSYAESGWEGTTTDFAAFTLPAYFSEFGSVRVTPRIWSEVPVLYGNSEVTNVWSGGVAFSYFPTNDGFGMTTISSDGRTVTPNADFTALAAVYTNVTLPTTPARASVSNAAAPSCPPTTATWLASTTLPPTPNESACNCLETNAFRCIATEDLSRRPTLIGDQINQGCSLLGQDGSTSTCTTIASNGQTGVYGPLSFCSAAIKVSYIYSAHYVFSNYNPQACNFAGNATINNNAPTNANAANTASTACLSGNAAVFTPSAAPSGAPAGPTGGTGSSSTAGGAAASRSPSASAGAGTGGTSAGSHVAAQQGMVGLAVAFGAVLLGGMLVV